MQRTETLYLGKRIRVYPQSNGALLVEFHNPAKRNAMDISMSEEAREVSSQYTDWKPRMVILTGSENVFSAGGDLDFLLELTQMPKEKSAEIMHGFYENFLSLTDVDCPTLAWINGHAVGAGFCVAASCDLRIVSESAKVGVNFVRIGLAPGMGAEYFIGRGLPQAVAAELLFTGKIIPARDLASSGFFNAVLPSAQLTEQVREITEQITANSLKGTSHSAHLLRKPGLTLSEVLAAEARAQGECFKEGQIPEAVDSFRNQKAFRFTV